MKKSKKNKDLSLEIESDINLLSKLRYELFSDPVARRILDKYDLDYKILLGVPILFSDTENSNAKTINGSIYISNDLKKYSFEVIMRYLIHELVHVCQHIRKDELDNDKKEEYIERGDEIEAFQYQVSYDANNSGVDEVVKYITDLLEFHDVPDDKKLKKGLELLRDIINDHDTTNNPS